MEEATSSKKEKNGDVKMEEATPKKEGTMIVHYDLSALVPFSIPLASKEFVLELMQTVRKASKKRQCRRGVKEVTKALKKNHKGLVVIAGDISPPDVISHIPILCEEHNVPYIFIPAKADLGFSCSAKRPTSVVMIVPDLKNEENFDYKDEYKLCLKQVRELEQAIIF